MEPRQNVSICEHKASPSVGHLIVPDLHVSLSLGAQGQLLSASTLRSPSGLSKIIPAVEQKRLQSPSFEKRTYCKNRPQTESTLRADYVGDHIYTDPS